MGIFDVTAILVTISAVFSYINYRFIKLPSAIGLMLIALVMSPSLIGLAVLGFPGLELAVEEQSAAPEGEPAALSPEDLERLRSLGYLQ